MADSPFSSDDGYWDAVRSSDVAKPLISLEIRKYAKNLYLNQLKVVSFVFTSSAPCRPPTPPASVGASLLRRLRHI
jgi:hypothetical protein